MSLILPYQFEPESEEETSENADEPETDFFGDSPNILN